MSQNRARAALSILLVIVSLVMSIHVAGAADRKPIGILEFEVSPQVQDAGLAKPIAAILTEALITNRSYEVIGPARAASILAEQGIPVIGFFDRSISLDFGQMKGFRYLVTGKIISAEIQDVQLNGFRQQRTKVVLAMRLINSNNGTVIYAETAVGEARKTFLSDSKDWHLADPQSAYNEAIRKAVAKLVDKIHAINPVSGLVIKVNEEDKSVLIDLGSEQGVSLGQQYSIYKEGTPIVHPVNQHELGKETKSLAVIKIVSVQNEYATGQVVSGELKDIKPLQPVSKL